MFATLVRGARRGFTLMELLVVIGIIVLLIGLIFPAVQRVREVANRLACASNLRQIGIAIANYRAGNRDTLPTGGGHSGYGSAPAPGDKDIVTVVPRAFTTGLTQTPRMGSWQTWGWAYQILPYLEENTAYETPRGVENEPYLHTGDQLVASRVIKLYFCPTRRNPQFIDHLPGNSVAPWMGRRGMIDYAGCFSIWSFYLPNNVPELPCLDYSGPGPSFRNGLFVKGLNSLGAFNTSLLDQPLRAADVRDGSSCTLMIAEKRLNTHYLAKPQRGEYVGYTCGYGPDTLRSAAYPPGRDWTDPNALQTDTFGSAHALSMNALFLDGSVRPVRYDLPDDPQVCPVWLPPLAERGILPLPSPPYPKSSMMITLFQRMCHRNDGGTIADELE